MILLGFEYKIQKDKKKNMFVPRGQLMIFMFDVIFWGILVKGAIKIKGGKTLGKIL